MVLVVDSSLSTVSLFLLLCFVCCVVFSERLSFLLLLDNYNLIVASITNYICVYIELLCQYFLVVKG